MFLSPAFSLEKLTFQQLVVKSLESFNLVSV